MHVELSPLQMPQASYTIPLLGTPSHPGQPYACQPNPPRQPVAVGSAVCAHAMVATWGLHRVGRVGDGLGVGFSKTESVPPWLLSIIISHYYY